MRFLVARLFACGPNTRTTQEGADTNTQSRHTQTFVWDLLLFSIRSSHSVPFAAGRKRSALYNSRVFARDAVAMHRHRKQWLGA
jgi:hypothetical protein